MCSYGGRIVSRPIVRTLYYLGGETRIVVIEHHSSLTDLSTKLSRSILDSLSFTLKYYLPNEDLNSLISVTTDEDNDNMIEEYDRILQSSSTGAATLSGGGGNTGSSRSSRLRLFLFPSHPISAFSLIGSLLDDSKFETWFVDALNNTMGIGIDGLSADSASSASRMTPPSTLIVSASATEALEAPPPPSPSSSISRAGTPLASSAAMARMSTPSPTPRCSTPHPPSDPPPLPPPYPTSL